jgi:Raf kinase inhibitor-like YbhB/YbcL family protein
MFIAICQYFVALSFVKMQTMKKFLIPIIALSLFALAGCAKKTVPDSQPIANPKPTMSQALLNFEVTSYPNRATMPAKFATKQGGGENTSIGLKWQPVPAAQSYALLFDDRAPVARNWVHWLVADIPITVTEIAEGASRTAMPEGSRELVTSWGKKGYDGPQPPIGSGNHEYVATLFALDTAKLSVPENPSRSEFLNAVEKHEITREEWSGFFQR